MLVALALVTALLLLCLLRAWWRLEARIAGERASLASHLSAEEAWRAHPHVHRLPSAEEHAAAGQCGGPEHTSAPIAHVARVDPDGLQHTRGISATFTDWSQTSDFGVATVPALARIVEKRADASA